MARAFTEPTNRIFQKEPLELSYQGIEHGLKISKRFSPNNEWPAAFHFEYAEIPCSFRGHKSRETWKPRETFVIQHAGVLLEEGSDTDDEIYNFDRNEHVVDRITTVSLLDCEAH